VETKVGTRVGAILEVNECDVKFLGFGQYVGDFIPEEAVGFLATFFKETHKPCPRIKLDSGKTVYGCECWWEEEKRVKKVILQGHSLTQKLVYYQSMKNDPRVIGQIHLSPGNDAGFMRFRLGEEKYFETNKLIKEMVEQGRERELLQEELAIVCPMAALAYYGYLTEDGVGNIFPYHNPGSTKWETLSKIKEPLLVIFGERDIFIKPSVDEAARLFKEKMSPPELITIEKITGANHSFIGYEKEVADIIHKWLKINYSHHIST